MAVIADHDADFAEGGVEHLEAIFRGRVVILLVKLLCLRDVHHFGNVLHLTVRPDPERSIVPMAVPFQIDVGGKIVMMLTGLLRQQAESLRVLAHGVGVHIFLFILREKRRELDFREEQQVAACRLIAVRKAFFQVLRNIGGHAHLCQCDFHNGAPFTFQRGPTGPQPNFILLYVPVQPSDGDLPGGHGFHRSVRPADGEAEVLRDVHRRALSGAARIQHPYRAA